MAGRVITLYCAGTAYDSKSRDVIAWCHANTKGTRGADFLFFPGPGSGEWGEHDARRLQARTGALRDGGRSLAAALPTPHRLAATFAVDSARTAADGVLGAARGALDGLEQATGDSMGATVAAAVAALRQLVGPGGGVTLNMAGWSRGAVTCVKLAWALAEDPVLGRCPVNLFLFDPVPGPKRLNSSNWTEDLRTLRGNIARLGVVLMEDEQRFGDSVGALMEPLTQPFTSCTPVACGEVPRDRVQLYPLPGSHGSAVEPDPADLSFAESAEIGAHLCVSFLREHGTPVAAERTLRPVEVLERYAALKLRLARRGRPALETRAAKVPNAERDGWFWVNAHHRATFAAQYPNVARVLDPGFNVRSWSPMVLSEARLLRGAAPQSALLVAGGVMGMIMAARGPLRMGRDHPDLEQLFQVLARQ